MMLRTTDEWEQVIGEQVRRLRLRENMRQDDLASRAKISRATLSGLESGRGSTLRTLVAVLNVLGETTWFESLAPKVGVSPIQVAQLMGSQRQRASARREEYDL